MVIKKKPTAPNNIHPSLTEPLDCISTDQARRIFRTRLSQCEPRNDRNTAASVALHKGDPESVVENRGTVNLARIFYNSCAFKM